MKENEFRYFAVRDLAWNFLIKNKVEKLPLDLWGIAQKNNWLIIEAEKLGIDLQNEICTLTIKKQHVIAYKAQLPIHRLRFGIAHEFGHILLKHLDPEFKLDHEKEANQFAARILTPLIVLKSIERNIGPLTANYISKLCGISLEAANIRLMRLREIETRKKFLTSQLEQQVLKQFEKFIKEQNK